MAKRLTTIPKLPWTLALGGYLAAQSLSAGIISEREVSIVTSNKSNQPKREKHLDRVLGDFVNGSLREMSQTIFHLGLAHQVLMADIDGALPLFEQSLQRAEEVSDFIMVSYALRHLGLAYLESGRI